MSRPHLAVVIPAYNEASRLNQSLNRVQEYLDTRPYSWSVLVVSDGSQDATATIAQSFCQKDSRFSVIEYQPNRGKGYAVKTGMLAAEGEWLLLCDADLAAPIEEVEKLFAAGTAVAIGSRPLKDSQLEVRQPWWREAGGRFLNRLIQWLAVPGIQDTQCGFKLFRHDSAKDIFDRCRINAYGYDFEALMLARSLGYKITEVPIRWAHQEGSKVHPLRDGLRTIWDLLLLRLTFRSRLKKPLHSSTNPKHVKS